MFGDWRNRVPGARPVDMKWNADLHRWEEVVRRHNDNNVPPVLSLQEEGQPPVVVVTDEDHSLTGVGGGGGGGVRDMGAAAVLPDAVGSSSSAVVAVVAPPPVRGMSSSRQDRSCRNLGRCGSCPGCLKEDCGECVMCLKKKKFGGKGSEGACIYRPCAGKAAAPGAVVPSSSNKNNKNSSGKKQLAGHRGGNKRCGSCPGCLRKDCGKCTKCKQKKKFGGPGSTGACIHRPCDMILARASGGGSAANKGGGGRQAVAGGGAARDDDDDDYGDDDIPPAPSTVPKMGNKVYCRWPADNEWYPGIVKKKYEHYGHPQYSIHFTDGSGDKRERVPLRDVLVLKEYLIQTGAAKRALEEEEEEEYTSDSKPPPKKKVRRPGALKNDQDDDGSDSAMIPRRDNNNDEETTSHNNNDRVYAWYSPTKSYYWGTVTSKCGQGESTKYSILYDDGDEEDNVAHQHVFSESQYNDMHHERAELIPIADNECQCALCCKDDCGTCQACVSNGHSTQPFKYSCLFKTCETTAQAQAQSFPGLPSGWKFFFENPEAGTSRGPPIHPKVAGLRVVSPGGDGKIYRGLWAAVRAGALTKKDAMYAEQQLYEKWLGLKIRIPFNEHELVGEPFCRHWVGVDGNQMLYGSIVACERNYFSNDLVFIVKYDASSLNLVNMPPGFDAPIIDKEEVSEMLAWGGHVQFQEKFGTRLGLSLPTTNKYTKWLLPDKIHRSLLPPDGASNGRQRPELTILFRGYRLALEARQSDIPNAGLGVFLTVYGALPLGLSDGNKTFILEPEEMLDLGPYAPLSNTDIKEAGGMLVLKNFIYKWACEAYAFDMDGPAKGKKVFDITCDSTGALHQAASENVHSFVNETDGKTMPTVHAMHDPHGSVHYMLGHENERFVIPLGEEIELKIDYGSSYERVRVREQYSRLNDTAREQEEHSLHSADIDTLRDIELWSVSEVDASIKFLATLSFNKMSSAAGRSLIAAVLLLKRLFHVKREFADRGPLPPGSFCDNGYSTMDDTGLVERAKDVVQWLLRVYKKDKDLGDVCPSDPVFVQFLIWKGIAATEADARKLNKKTIRRKIRDLCNEKS